MGKYRKKPVEVEAFKWTGAPDQEVEPLWFIQAMRKGDVIIYRTTDVPYMEIVTLEGTMTAKLNDYIIRGVKGELYPCNPVVFNLTYEKV